MKKIILILLFLLTLTPQISLAAYNPGLYDTQKEMIIEMIKEETDLSKVKQELQDEKVKISEELDEKLNIQTRNFIEIIGLFSAIIALIIINLGIIKSAETFLQAVSLMIGLTSSMVIFAGLIHWYFSPNPSGWTLLPSGLGALVLIGLLVVGIIKDFKLRK